MARQSGRDDGPFANIPEEELLAAVLAGKPGAWAGFYRRYDRLIFTCIRKVLHRYTAVYGEEDLEDMASSACLNLVKDDYHKLRMFDPTRGYKLSSWVGLIATNTAHDALRRREPIHASLDASRPGESEDEGPRHHPADEGPRPGDTLEEQEQWGQICAAMRELSASDQQFLSLYYEQELEPEDIARTMGISVNTVYSRKNKVREKLRKLVEHQLGTKLGSGQDPGHGPGKTAGREA